MDIPITWRDAEMTLFLSLWVGDSLLEEEPDCENWRAGSWASSRLLWVLEPADLADSVLSCSGRLLQWSTTISGSVKTLCSFVFTSSLPHSFEWITCCSTQIPSSWTVTWSSVVSESVLYCLSRALLSILVVSLVNLEDTNPWTPHVRLWFGSDDSESQLGDFSKGLGLLSYKLYYII